MKRLRHYFPNYLLTVLLVFSVSALSVLIFAANCVFSPSFYISSAERNDVYKRVADYTVDYFEKSYAVSGIPAEIYTEGLEEKIVRQAVDGKINSFFDFVTGKTGKQEEVEIDFSLLEKNVSDYFDKFAKEKNVEINDEFKKQLDKTIKTAESEIESFTNVFMFDYMEKAGVTAKLKQIYPYVNTGVYAAAAVTALCVILLIVLNIKRISGLFYWLSAAGLCSSAILLIPCVILKQTDYFGRLVMRTDYIYAAVTGVLNDMVDELMRREFVIAAVSAVLMILFAVISLVSGKKDTE